MLGVSMGNGNDRCNNFGHFGRDSLLDTNGVGSNLSWEHSHWKKADTVQDSDMSSGGTSCLVDKEDLSMSSSWAPACTFS